MDALIEGLEAEKIPVTVAGPLGEKVSCYYGFLEETKTAVMEMASAAGITLVTKKDPLRASTYGVGEMIADALKRGCKKFHDWNWWKCNQRWRHRNVKGAWI